MDKKTLDGHIGQYHRHHHGECAICLRPVDTWEEHEMYAYHSGGASPALQKTLDDGAKQLEQIEQRSKASEQAPPSDEPMG